MNKLVRETISVTILLVLSTSSMHDLQNWENTIFFNLSKYGQYIGLGTGIHIIPFEETMIINFSMTYVENVSIERWMSNNGRI